MSKTPDIFFCGINKYSILSNYDLTKFTIYPDKMQYINKLSIREYILMNVLSIISFQRST